MLGNDKESVYILYTNYKGETEWRHVVPIRLVYKSTPHHPDEQWILKSHDLDKDAERDFAMKDVRQWQTNPPPVVPRYERMGRYGIVTNTGRDICVVMCQDPRMVEQVLFLMNHGVLTTSDYDTEPFPKEDGK